MENAEMKELLGEAWKEVFQKDSVRDEDSFFEVGGDSIKAVQLASWLAQKGVKLELGNVFTAQTFGAIAETLSEIDPMYVPPEIMTKEIAQREFGLGGNQGMAQTADMANQQLCDPANNAQAANMANQQLCDPANNVQAANMANQQLYNPAGMPYNQMMYGYPYGMPSMPMYGYTYGMPSMPMYGYPYGMPGMPMYGYVLMPVLVPMMPYMGMAPMMGQQMGMMPQMPSSPGMPQMPMAGMMPGMPQAPMFSPEQAQRFNSYFARPIEHPVENPNVVKINKPTVGKAEKSAEEVLDYVLNGLVPGYKKEENLFQQGLSSLDVMKLITRCGEYGYQLDMETVFLTPTFSEIAAEMKGNQ